MKFWTGAWRALLLAALCLACAFVRAQARFEYAAPAYAEAGGYVRGAPTPEQACASYAAIWGWNRSPYSTQTIQVQPGYWTCQRFYQGTAEPSWLTHVAGQCQLDTMTPLSWLTGRPVSYPQWDRNAGVCVCSPGSVFNREIQWCERVTVTYTITLKGPSRTKALVAGPALLHTATVAASNGAPASGIGVNIAIASGGNISGSTDATGSFTFTYVPPARATVDHLKATCGNCSNAAEKDITVDPCDVCEPTVGNPIQPATGEKLQTETDWSDASPHPLSLTRTYRSFGAPASGLGGNWSLPWSASVIVQDVEASVRLGDGRRVLFRRDTAAQPWQADASADSLTPSVGGFVYRRAADGTTWSFDTAGQLTRITQRNGWAETVQRDAAGNVASVSNAFGRRIVFSYNASNRLDTATMPDGSRVTYGFDTQGRLAAVYFADGTSRGYLYEDAANPGALTGIVDERGVRIATFAYDARGYAVSTQHAGAQAFTVTYTQAAQAHGQLVIGTNIDSGLFRTSATVSDPLGTPRTYEWVGGDGQVYLASGDRAGGITNFASRTGAGLPTQETDFAGVTTTYAWDAVRRVKTQQIEVAGRAEARATDTEWHPVFDLPARITQAGRMTTYAYDDFGNKLSETIADIATGETRTRTWAYNAQALVTSETGPRGDVWRYGYDSAGNRISVVDPLGNETQYAFDAAGRVVFERSPTGVATIRDYDRRGRMVRQSRGGEVTVLSYTPTGQLAHVVLPNGAEVAYAYDAANRLVAVTDSRGTSVTYTLDGAGNRVREEVKDANGNIAWATARVIDSLGQVTASNDAAGATTQFGYDANGAPVATTDALNQTTRQSLDALRRPITTVYPDNASTRQTWNALDAVTQVTDPKGVQTQYATNAFGDVTSDVSADAGTTTYRHDSAGRIVESTDGRGITARITRDALGRAVEIKYDDEIQTFAYDAQGDVTRIDDASGSTSYVRDALGRVLVKTQTVNDVLSSPSKYVLRYAYIAGELASIQYPSGLQVTYRRTAGRITQVDVQAPGSRRSVAAVIPFATSIEYTALGQPRSWTWFNGDSATRSFDGNARMTANEFSAYTWDAANRITGITQNLWVSAGPQLSLVPVTWDVGYDSHSRITSMKRDGHSASFTYDPNSNRVSRLEIATADLDLEGQFDSPGVSLTTSETPEVDSSSNRLLGFSVTATGSNGAQSSTSISEVKYVVDAVGNMTGDGLRTFVYSASNRLSKVQAAHGIEAVGYEYLHNALGQRVFKSGALMEEPEDARRVTRGFVDWLQSTLGWLFKGGGARGRTLDGLAFVYDEEGNLLAAYGNGSNTAAQEEMEYIWLPLENGSSIPIGAFKRGQFHAVHTDHLGTPRLITDGAKAPVWQWPYSAFGSNKPTGVLKKEIAKRRDGSETSQLKWTTPALDSKLRFPGQYFDAESGLNQNWFREYSARNGRYVQSDPVGLSGGINTFTYVGANPVSLKDRRGLAADALPLPPAALPTLTGLCLANPMACGVGLAGAGGFAAGTLLYPLIEPVATAIDQCLQDNSCPPCTTVSGKVVPLGTIAYRPMDTPPLGKAEHGIMGPHYNIYKANQAPKTSSRPCQCFWQPAGAVPPSGLPATAIPIEPFAK